MMKILVIGGGGREHALAWKAAQSRDVERVYVAPGNAGTAIEEKCENVAIAAEDIDALLDFARQEAIDLTIVGPEAPLVAGIIDEFDAAGLACFGPNRPAGRLPRLIPRPSASVTRFLPPRTRISPGQPRQKPSSRTMRCRWSSRRTGWPRARA